MSGTQTDWDGVSFVEAGTYRRVVAEALAEQPQTPSEITDASGIEIAHVSRTLSDLRDRGIAELLVSEDTRKGRIYGLTDAGSCILETVQERADD